MTVLVRWRVFLLAVLALGLAPIPQARALELPAVFADHMVLQRDMPVPVWGKAEPGTLVSVAFGSLQVETVTDDAGKWRVDLPAMPASAKPRLMTVTGWRQENPPAPITIADILVGDVWHCSGQSNMEWSVERSNDAAAEIAAADYPLIRHFTVPRTGADSPRFTSEGTWKITAPDTIAKFSAVGYAFGRSIHLSQDVPIGLIGTAWGAASAEAFTSMHTLLADPFTAKHVNAMNARPQDARFRQQTTPAAIFHGMIHPVAPFAHRGVIWYQGEGNAGRAVAYRDLLPRMIEDWRALWDQPGEHRDTPFLIVQLAHFKQPHDQPPAYDGWGELRDSQARVAATVPNVYLATAIDIGDADDIHPGNKQDVGRRLARLADHHVYGDESVVPVGPTMLEVSNTLEPSSRSLVMWDNSKGLTTSDGQPPRGFAIRPLGSKQAWVWASAKIRHDLAPVVVLEHPDGVLGPFEVRYAYGINPTDGPQGINLVNGEGLPAMPFRTDPVLGD
ncbi:MAG: sialate O-acetylesterase [Planctomycetota bacterium]